MADNGAGAAAGGGALYGLGIFWPAYLVYEAFAALSG